MPLYLVSRDQSTVSWDEYDSFVIRASSEAEARRLAHTEGGPSGGNWLDPQEVKCEVIDASGPSEIILGSFNAG